MGAVMCVALTPAEARVSVRALLDLADTANPGRLPPSHLPR